MSEIHLGIIDHPNSLLFYQSEFLGGWLESLGSGVTVTLLHADKITLGRSGELLYKETQFPHVDMIIWRVDEGLSLAYDNLLTAIDKKYILVNDLNSLWITSNKLLTHDLLTRKGVPVVFTVPAFPGNRLSMYEIAKPQHGSHGRGIVREIIPTGTIEPYVKQEYYGTWDNFLQILIVNNEIITSFRRHETRDGVAVYPRYSERDNESLLFTNAYPELEVIALEAAQATTAAMVSVDICISQKQVLEINGVPYLPKNPEIMEKVATNLLQFIHQAGN